jgi:hypothetical protein
LPEFPTSPLPPAEFFERFLPEAFAAAGIVDALDGAELSLGVRLEGRGGGEWLLRMGGGAVSVEPGSCEAALVTIVQSVADWRGALWEGRGGAFGRYASALFRPGAGAAALGALGLGGPLPASLRGQLEALGGLLRLCLTAGDGPEWSLAVKLGPGEVPAEPSTTVTLSADDADALARGELGAVEAFLGGRVQVAGDVALLLQLQALQLELSSARPAADRDA